MDMYMLAKCDRYYSMTHTLAILDDSFTLLYRARCDFVPTRDVIQYGD
jgi:hypothetical protein